MLLTQLTVGSSALGHLRCVLGMIIPKHTTSDETRYTCHLDPHVEPSGMCTVWFLGMQVWLLPHRIPEEPARWR